MCTSEENQWENVFVGFLELKMDTLTDKDTHTALCQLLCKTFIPALKTSGNFVSYF